MQKNMMKITKKDWEGKPEINIENNLKKIKTQKESMGEIDIKANQKISWFKINFNSSLLVHALLGFYFNIYQSKYIIFWI